MKNTKDIKEKEENHLALYRKYRPQRFEDVLGQEIALKTLENAIKQNKLYHAYLFSGDRGTGKTTVARIFANNIGCSNDDIFELDAASNNSVEDIRLLTEAAQSSTFGSKYKIYILDEVHMLSKPAFNALLKTLEEPPAHVIFILATTDKHKIPNTIISRCQEILFLSPKNEDLISLIDKVSEKENRKLDKRAKEVISEKSKGSFRDMLGILEKVFTTIDSKEISQEDINSIFGIVDEEKILNIIKAICENNIEDIILNIKSINLNTINAIDNTYYSLVKTFEKILLLRFIKLEEASKIFEEEIGDVKLNEMKDMSDKYSNIISSSNLYKLLQMEKDLSINTIDIKKSIFTIGIINIAEVKKD